MAKQIYKFGGTSLADTSAFKKVISLVEDIEPGLIIVVSAIKGVTNSLENLCDQSKNQDAQFEESINSLDNIHLDISKELLSDSDFQSFNSVFKADIIEIKEILRGVWISKNLPDSTKELICCYGESWSSRILYFALKAKGKTIQHFLTSDFLVVENGEVGKTINWNASTKLLEKTQLNVDNCFSVTTGFIAQNQKGTKTTLGRNGSDFSASILGKLFEVQKITIWTDVDGVFSADPRRVPEAQLVSQISYKEAMELAYFGAKILHPHTMGPALEKNIDIQIKNTFNPECTGTLITKNPSDKSQVVKGFSTVDGISLVNVEGSGMVGVPGVAQRLFGSLKEVGVSVIMISQASSEHSICFAIPSEQSQLAEKSIHECFALELANSTIQSVSIDPDCSILAAVGDNMVQSAGMAAKLFAALGSAGINIRAIAQGSSERNISVIIQSNQTTKALRAAHSGFFLSNLTFSVGLIGPGAIGETLIQQIQERAENLKTNHQLDFRIRGICNSSKMLIDDKSINLNDWKNEFENSTRNTNIDEFVDHVHADFIPHSVIIDCTANESIAKKYSDWMNKGLHIVTPNKKAPSDKFINYKNLMMTSKLKSKLFFYEATVGAGLPIITTLQDLVQTGDKILKIEGIVSGTLSHIFNTLSENSNFSQIVRSARDAGFTEPDPRDDLSGMDVARKMVILSREAGFQLEIEDISVESLIPKELKSSLSVDAFLEQLKIADQSFQKQIALAAQDKKVLRYVGSVDCLGKASVGIQEYPNTHPFARLQGTDNIIAFTTERYKHQPLIIQGPGAGPEVTAAGVFSDLIRLANQLGAKQS